MPVKKLLDYLDSKHVKYVLIRHSRAYTAQEIAQAAHIPGATLAKTVMVKIDGAMAMAVLRGPDKIDRDLLRGCAGAASCELASEEEFRNLFAQIEVGAMPPFGNLYDLPVYVDEALARDERIAFNAGSHTELVQLAYADFVRLVQPKSGNFTR
ncbi:MAG: YbaK/EbsC family protein [Gammaproteobacteria bacterium]|nr:YbaK/EbsC family protein [Gammaproteobacteria bacterium]